MAPVLSDLLKAIYVPLIALSGVVVWVFGRCYLKMWRDREHNSDNGIFVLGTTLMFTFCLVEQLWFFSARIIPDAYLLFANAALIVLIIKLIPVIAGVMHLHVVHDFKRHSINFLVSLLLVFGLWGAAFLMIRYIPYG